MTEDNEMLPSDLNRDDVFGTGKVKDENHKRLIRRVAGYEYVSIVSWMVMHECYHLGGEKTLNEINNGAAFEYNPWDSDSTDMVYAFNADNALDMMGKIDGLCGGTHYRLVDGRYEEFKPEMIGGFNVSNKEELKQALNEFTERNQPLMQEFRNSKNTALENTLKKGNQLN